MLLVINMKTGGFHLTTVRMAKRNLGNIIWDKRADSLLFQSKDLMMLIKRLLLGYMEELWPSSFLGINGLTGKGKFCFFFSFVPIKEALFLFLCFCVTSVQRSTHTSNSHTCFFFEVHCLLLYTTQFTRKHIHRTEPA